MGTALSEYLARGDAAPLLPGSDGLDFDSQELAEDRLADAEHRADSLDLIATEAPRCPVELHATDRLTLLDRRAGRDRVAKPPQGRYDLRTLRCGLRSVLHRSPLASSFMDWEREMGRRPKGLSLIPRPT
jgi:hypothetical protein